MRPILFNCIHCINCCFPLHVGPMIVPDPPEVLPDQVQGHDGQGSWHGVLQLRKAVVAVRPCVLLCPSPASFDGVQLWMKLHKLKFATEHCTPWSISAMCSKVYLGQIDAVMFQVSDEVRRNC